MSCLTCRDVFIISRFINPNNAPTTRKITIITFLNLIERSKSFFSLNVIPSSSQTSMETAVSKCHGNVIDGVEYPPPIKNIYSETPALDFAGFLELSSFNSPHFFIVILHKFFSQKHLTNPAPCAARPAGWPGPFIKKCARRKFLWKGAYFL